MNFSNNIFTFAIMKTEYRKKAGEILQTARVQKGLSVEYVAEQAGCKPATLLKIESGLFSLNMDMLIALARALEIDLTLNNEVI